MIVQAENESRIKYLLRVAEQFCLQNAESHIDYDDVTCDGSCLANDINSILREMEEE